MKEMFICPLNSTWREISLPFRLQPTHPVRRSIFNVGGYAHPTVTRYSADEIGRQIQAYALYCGISPTGINSKSLSAGGDLLENPSGKEHAEWDFDFYMDICRARFRKDKPPVIRSPTTSPLKLKPSFLAAYTKLEDPLASIGRRKIVRTQRKSWRSHRQPLP
nr:uncharacterized protein LOC118878518 isoform X2 [Drosophila suzukii]